MEIAFNKDEILDELATLRITWAQANFDGYSDEGFVNEVDIEPLSVVDVEERVRDVAYDVLETFHSGWELNEGSFGEITFDVTNRTINITFNERYETYNTTEESL